MVASEHTMALDTCQGPKGTVPTAQRRWFFHDTVLPSGLAMFWDSMRRVIILTLNIYCARH